MSENEKYDVSRIKEEVSRLHNAGVKLFFEWDAGGDSASCWPVTEPSTEIDTELEDLLRSEIISELELLRDEDRYQKGRGEIFFTPENALAIRFSANVAKGVDDDELPDTPEYSEQQIELEDVGGLQKFLVKGDIYLELKVNWKKEITFSLQFHVQEGDVPFLMPNEEEYYIGALLPYTEVYTKHFQINEKNNFGGYVSLTCRLKKSEKASFTIYESYQHITEITNKEVILLP
jgi:hypothetical protein